jgi:hypothetical protein
MRSGTDLKVQRTTKGVVSMFSRKLSRSIAAGTLAIAVAIGAYATINSNSATGVTGVANAAGGPASGSNARSGPAAGGTAGTVAAVSSSSFTVSTSTGLKVTVDETSSTVYEKGTTKISASAITTGKHVLVLGKATGGTITTAKKVIVSWRPTRSSSAAGVVGFQQGAPSAAKQAGQIPANYQQGSGTIVSGTAANKATKAALAAYPGGVVDRVVKLSNGEYEVHNIGVNWPHHVFVNQNFVVVGAN